MNVCELRAAVTFGLIATSVSLIVGAGSFWTSNCTWSVCGLTLALSLAVGSRVVHRRSMRTIRSRQEYVILGLTLIVLAYPTVFFVTKWVKQTHQLPVPGVVRVCGGLLIAASVVALALRVISARADRGLTAGLLVASVGVLVLAVVWAVNVDVEYPVAFGTHAWLTLNSATTAAIGGVWFDRAEASARSAGQLAVAPEPAQRDTSLHPRPSRRPGEP